jgi:hypothetical protein
LVLWFWYGQSLAANQENMDLMQHVIRRLEPMAASLKENYYERFG